MFIYDKRDGGVTVRRIENKMGIKGSPTCELVYKNAKAELCGSRRMGLIKYVMALMNGARLGIAAQSVGVSGNRLPRVLWHMPRTANSSARPSSNSPLYSRMLATMKAKLDASRSLLYETSRYVDLYKAYDDIAKERALTPEEKKNPNSTPNWPTHALLWPKGLSSEYCNQNAYDCIQIHGGSGFMKDYACERVYRDARITSIYEGTTQLQVVAAIRHVTTGTVNLLIDSYREQLAAGIKPALETAKANLEQMTEKYNAAIASVLEAKDTAYVDFMARRLVEMAGNIIA